MEKKTPIKMPLKDRRILTYYYKAGYSIKAIAAILEITESEVKIKKDMQAHNIVRWFCKEFNL
jgi:DNA-directed RNA polymerase specialized sigma subunit